MLPSIEGSSGKLPSSQGIIGRLFCSKVDKKCKIAEIRILQGFCPVFGSYQYVENKIFACSSLIQGV